VTVAPIILNDLRANRDMQQRIQSEGNPAVRVDWDSPRLWTLFCVALLTNSILRGIRVPGRFTLTEMLQTYEFGFSRRALLGTILHAMKSPWLCQYKFLFCLTFFTFALCVALTIRLIIQLNAMRRLTVHLVVVVFSSSFAFVVLASALSFGDYVGLATTLLALRVTSFSLRSILVITLFPLSLLIHETNFVIFFPVIFMRFLIDMEPPVGRPRILSLFSVLLSTVATLVALSHANVSQESAQQLYDVLQRRTDVPLQKWVFVLLPEEPGSIMRMGLSMWNEAEYRYFFLACSVVTLPTTIYILSRLFRNSPIARYDWLMRVVIAISGLAPLSLSLIAWDLQRWATLTITTSFLTYAMITLKSHDAESHDRTCSLASILLPAALVAMNLGSTIPLSDGYIVQSFPYGEHVLDIAKIWRGEETIPPKLEACSDVGCITLIGDHSIVSQSATRKQNCDGECN
jgi:hypothetical protein